MNILVTSADGPNAIGLKVLIGAARQQWKEANLVILVPAQAGPYTSMGTTRKDWTNTTLEDLKKVGTNYYLVEDATATDLVDLAFLRQDLFLTPKALWDVVLTGVTHGSVTGLDALRHGNTCAAMYAAHAYRCGAHTFAQQLDPGTTTPNEVQFRPAYAILADYFRSMLQIAGECWSLNIPAAPSLGYQTVPPAHYSSWRKPPTSLIPRANDEKSDTTQLERGVVTCSLLSLRMNTPLRY